MNDKFRNKIAKTLVGKIEDESRNWKGQNAGYAAIHIWVKKKLGCPQKCENPNCVYPKPVKYRKPINKPSRFEWASISRISNLILWDTKLLILILNRQSNWLDK